MGQEPPMHTPTDRALSEVPLRALIAPWPRYTAGEQISAGIFFI